MAAIEREDIRENIRLLGYQPHTRLLEEAGRHHVFLSPSITANDGDSEGGAPVSLIEMSAAGMMTVSTAHCDIPQVIRHRETGLLAGERDVDGLVKNLHWLLEHPDEWRGIRRAARRHIEANFDAAKQGRNLAAIYAELAGQRRERTKPRLTSQSTVSGPIRIPKILFVSHTAELYGAERSLLTLVVGLKERELADVVVLLPKFGPLQEALRANGIRTHIIQSFRWIGDRTGVGSILKWFARTSLNVIATMRAWRWARRWNPDLIYTNTVAIPVGVYLALLLGKPHIWHVREWISKELNASYDLGQSLVMYLLRRNKGEVIFNSRELAEKYLPHLPDTNPIVVYNGFDFSHLAAPKPEEHYARTVEDASTTRLAVIGSVYPVKGQDDAIRALAVLLDKGFRVDLEITGSGSEDYIEQLRSLASELEIADKVRFNGYSNNVADDLNSIAVTLVPSKFEPFGRIAVESMAFGVPVVAAATGGLKEIVSDGVTGMFYAPGNYGELAERVAALLKDKDLYTAIAGNGWRNVTERFSNERYIQGVWSTISKAMEQGKEPGSRRP